MKPEELENWKRIKQALESADKKDSFFYKRAVDILDGKPDPLKQYIGVDIIIMAQRMAGQKLKDSLTPNKPRRTPDHPTKSHVVLAKEGGKEKLIGFGEQGAKTAGKPKEGESDKMKKKRASFKARHGKNIAKGKMSAAYWADKEKW